MFMDKSGRNNFANLAQVILATKQEGYDVAPEE